MSSMTPLRSRNRASARHGSFLTGCLIALAVVVILAVAGGLFVMTQWRGWTASLATAGMTVLVEKLELPDEDQALILARVDDLAKDFKDKKISKDQLLAVGVKLIESPLIQAVGVFAVEKNYFEDSGLSAQEKADASLQLDRLARGLYEETISVEEAQDAMDEIVVQTAGGNNNIEFRDPDSVDDDDLRQLITEVRAAADEAEIPNEPFEIDIAAEFIKAIDEALGVAAADPPQLSSETGEDEPTGGEGGEGGGG